MSLVTSRFLRDHRDEIIREWEKLAVSEPREARAADTTLREAVAELLDGIAEWLEQCAPTRAAGIDRVSARYARERQARGFQLAQVSAEFEVLRSVILDFLFQAEASGQRWKPIRQSDVS